MNRVTALAVLVLLAPGCNYTVTRIRSADGGASDGTTGSDAFRPFDLDPRCTGALNCPSGQVCDPVSERCVDDLPCTDHATCGVNAHCGTDGKCAPSKTGSPCGTAANCLPTDDCIAGTCGCGGEPYTAEKVPPNVLIVLDRSQSMNDGISGGTKWTVAQQAIADLLAAYGGEIRFGLALYPGEDQDCNTGVECGAGTVFVDPGDSTASQINTFLGDAGTCSFRTPTAEMLQALITYAGLEDGTRANYVLLITDGQSTCDDPDPVVTALRNQLPEIKTFVIGFGSSVDPDELNDMAVLGGTAITGGPPYYYVAGDAASLGAAFSTIAGSVLSCSYTLSERPPDLDELYVYQDKGDGKVEIPRDPNQLDGWDYNAANNQVTFYGPACEALQSGQITELLIVYGCPIVID